MTYRKILLLLSLFLLRDSWPMGTGPADLTLVLHIAQIRDHHSQGTTDQASPLRVRTASGRQQLLHPFQGGLYGLQVEGHAAGKVQSCEAAPIGPGAQRVSLVAQMEVAVVLAAQRR